MSAHLLVMACAAVFGWSLSGMWRGTTRRGYILALNHVEQMTRPARTSLSTTYTLDEALQTLREENR